MTSKRVKAIPKGPCPRGHDPSLRYRSGVCGPCNRESKRKKLPRVYKCYCGDPDKPQRRGMCRPCYERAYDAGQLAPSKELARMRREAIVEDYLWIRETSPSTPFPLVAERLGLTQTQLWEVLRKECVNVGDHGHEGM